MTHTNTVEHSRLILAALTLPSTGGADPAAEFVGLIIVTPILGYASWHAYRETLIPKSNADSGGETGI